ncbi:hypothetical protein ABES02_29270 [Neobacillus pocheonensis]|uniref:hypothetical protein n=1 Tax=Neobacillus pocheonensis TaxID=363869 RepID=UPI003D28B297
MLFLFITSFLLSLGIGGFSLTRILKPEWFGDYNPMTSRRDSQRMLIAGMVFLLDVVLFLFYLIFKSTFDKGIGELKELTDAVIGFMSQTVPVLNIGSISIGWLVVIIFFTYIIFYTLGTRRR